MHLKKDKTINDFFSRKDIQFSIKRNSEQTDILKLQKCLQKEFSPAEALFISQQVVLRRKASKKFFNPDKMFFETMALEQSSHSAVSRYHASLISFEDTMLEVCTGLGSDLIEFSKVAKKIYSVEVNKDIANIAKYNVSSLGNFSVVNLINAPIENINFHYQVTSIFADPSRRITNKRLVFPEDYSPGLKFLLELADKLKVADGKCFVKLSPACDYKSLLFLGNIKVVSFQKQVREILFFYNRCDFGKKEAVIIDVNGAVIYRIFNTLEAEPRRISKVLKYIVEPDSAIIRAGLVADYAREVGAELLDNHIAYLTTNVKVFSIAHSIFEVIEVFAFNIKKIRKFLRENGIKELSVKKRGINQLPEKILKELKVQVYSNVNYLFIYRCLDGHKAIFAKRCL